MTGNRVLRRPDSAATAKGADHVRPPSVERARRGCQSAPVQKNQTLPSGATARSGVSPLLAPSPSATTWRSQVRPLSVLRSTKAPHWPWGWYIVPSVAATGTPWKAQVGVTRPLSGSAAPAGSAGPKVAPPLTLTVQGVWVSELAQT